MQANARDASTFAALRGTAQPLVPLGIFRSRPLSVANLVNLLVIGSFAGYVLVVTLFLQEVHGYSPLVTGLTFLAAGVAGFTAGTIAPRLMGRAGLRVTLTLAAAVQAAGLAVLVTLPASGTIAVVALLAVVVNFADVVAIVMVNIAATTGVPTERQGLAGGILNASQQIGAALGVAVISSIATSVTSSHTPSAHIASPSAAALLHGFRWGLAVAAAISLTAAALSLSGLPRPTEAATATPDPDNPPENAHVIA